MHSKKKRHIDKEKQTRMEKKQEYQDNTDRIEVEQEFSVEKHSYGLGLIVTKLEETQLTSNFPRRDFEEDGYAGLISRHYVSLGGRLSDSQPKLSDTTEYYIGKYGRMRWRFLKENHGGDYKIEAKLRQKVYKHT